MQPPCGMWAHFPSNLAISLSILGPLLVNIQVPQCSFPAWPPLGLSVMTWINLWQAHCLLVNHTLTDSTRTQCLRPAQECWSVSEITALRSSGRIPVKHHIVRPARRDAYSLRVQPGVGGCTPPGEPLIAHMVRETQPGSLKPVPWAEWILWRERWMESSHESGSSFTIFLSWPKLLTCVSWWRVLKGWYWPGAETHRAVSRRWRCECYVNCTAFKEILGDPEGGDQRVIGQGWAEGLRVFIVIREQARPPHHSAPRLVQTQGWTRPDLWPSAHPPEAVLPPLHAPSCFCSPLYPLERAEHPQIASPWALLSALKRWGLFWSPDGTPQRGVLSHPGYWARPRGIGRNPRPTAVETPPPLSTRVKTLVSVTWLVLIDRCCGNSEDSGVMDKQRQDGQGRPAWGSGTVTLNIQRRQ